MKICPKCNAKLFDEASFCTGCGNDVRGIPVEGSAPVEDINKTVAADAFEIPELPEMEEEIVVDDVNDDYQSQDFSDPIQKFTEEEKSQQSAPQQSAPQQSAPQKHNQQYQQSAPQQQYNQQQYNQQYQQSAPQQQYNQQYQQNAQYGYQQQGYQGQAYAQYQAPSYDHTADFDPQDISDNKVFCMLPYLTGTFGIIIALLASSNSDYTLFHVRQAVKISVLNILLGLAALFLIWTVIVPVVAGIMIFVLFVVRIIAFIQICQGKAIEPVIVRSIGLLK